MQNKSEEAYFEAFKHLQDAIKKLGLNAKPKYISTDFEIAAIKAFCKVFEGTVLAGKNIFILFWYNFHIKTIKII